MGKELSIFIDESGMFGDFDAYTPYYVIGIVLHDQGKPILEQEEYLRNSLKLMGLKANTYIHSGPIIVNKPPFKRLDGQTRRKLLMKLFEFFRNTDAKYEVFTVDRKYVTSMEQIINNLTEQINEFIFKNFKVLSNYREIKIYYDRGRIEISRIIKETFCTKLKNASMKNQVSPRKYRFLQVADLVCTLELIDFKAKNHIMTKSEINFFRNYKTFNSVYLKALRRKRF